MVNVQGDFSNYFDLVQNKATTSKFYTDIQKFFQEGKIDAKTYASIMTEYHASTLRESIETARSMSIGIRELELKTNESVASVALSNRRTTAISEELTLKNNEFILRQNEHSKNLILLNAKITSETQRASLMGRQIKGFTDNLKVKASAHASGLYAGIEQGGLSAPQDVINKTMETLDNLITASTQ